MSESPPYIYELEDNICPRCGMHWSKAFKLAKDYITVFNDGKEVLLCENCRSTIGTLMKPEAHILANMLASCLWKDAEISTNGILVLTQAEFLDKMKAIMEALQP